MGFRWAVAIALVAGCGHYGFTRSADAMVPLTYAAAVLADAPVAYWRLDDTGLVAKDSAGSDDGTFSGGCTLGAAGALAADSDTAVTFDGTSCVVELGDGLNFAGTAPYTLELWVNTPSNTKYEHFFTRETRTTPGDASPVDGYAVLQNAQGDTYSERAISGSSEATASTTITPAVWDYIVVTYDGNAAVMYIDATLAGSHRDTRSLATFTTNGMIGARPGGGYTLGTIDEVAVYDHVLADDRIALHYQLATQGPMPDQLAGW